MLLVHLGDLCHHAISHPPSRSFWEVFWVRVGLDNSLFALFRLTKGENVV
jgi:hypothetical protein